MCSCLQFGNAHPSSQAVGMVEVHSQSVTTADPHP